MNEDSSFWVVSSRVLISESEGAIREEPRAILVQRRRVAQIAHAEELRSGSLKDAASARKTIVIDVGDSPVVPTFVNAHTHLALGPLRGITSIEARAGNVVTDLFFEIERHLTAADVRVFTKLGAYESLLCGVGEVWDHYYFGEQVAEALFEVGLPGIVAPTLQDLCGPGEKNWEAQLAATEKIRSSERFAGGGVRAAFGPHASDTVSRGLLARVGELARRWNLPIHLHFAQSVQEIRAQLPHFTRGAANELSQLFDKARVLMAHGLYLSESDCQVLVDANWVLAYCPFSQMQFGFLSPFSTWLDCGGRWVVGTDCVASNDALDVQRELPLISGEQAIGTSFSIQRQNFLSQGGLGRAESIENTRRARLSSGHSTSPEDLMRGAWAEPLLEKAASNSPGLSVGALASFLVLRPEHPALFPGSDLVRTLAYGATAGAIDWAVFGGRIWGRDGEFSNSILSSSEYQACLFEARARRSELLDRAGLRDH